MNGLERIQIHFKSS